MTKLISRVRALKGMPLRAIAAFVTLAATAAGFSVSQELALAIATVLSGLAAGVIPATDEDPIQL